MHIEQVREFALSLPDTIEDCPFGPTVVVFKTNNKIFLLLPLDTSQLQFNVKCNPELAIMLRQEFPESILPGYHMNKKHWNTICVDGRIEDKKLLEFIRDSFDLVKATRKV